ncbi:cupin domain-containing protein [Conexibacter sp. DBS9H8]|uniref:cupin domain-containing protein n=1 Tax=Conexibacter sp. DBS9H8 TaxID=2937801 RepID=UPI00200CBBE5|nr:cupin domain-containing protein [Conexibacter sp. DBS9H8]
MSDLPDGVGTARLDAAAADRFLRLRDALGVTSFGINKLVLTPRQRNRIHRHTGQEEVYVVLAGELTLAVEGVEHRFGAGEIVRVAPAVRRQLINRGPADLELLVLGSMVDRAHVSRDAEAFADWADSEPGTPQTVPLPEDLPAGA